MTAATVASPGDSQPDIHLRNIGFAFAGRPLFEMLDFTIAGGEWTCLLGPSGVGKSTLLRIISGSLKARSEAEIRRSDGSSLQNKVAWMGQDDLLLPWLPVMENVCLGARLRRRMSPQTRLRAEALLKRAGLWEAADALPGALSGGMRQRVALLRTLMENRPVILMDEPFSALDALTRLNLQDMAAGLLKDATVLLVTHDPLEALRLGHHIYVLHGQPARLGDALRPSGIPPRDPGDPNLAALQAQLIARLRP